MTIKIRNRRKFLREVDKDSLQSVNLCYQCGKCSAGCPLASFMDILPNQVIRLVQLGVEDVLECKAIWLCASCETCTTRCPNGIDIAKVMDRLREMALKSGIKAAEKNIPAFHHAFLASIEGGGRVNELGMSVRYIVKSKEFFKHLRLGIQMMRHGKIKSSHSKIRALREVQDIFKEAKKKGAI